MKKRQIVLDLLLPTDQETTRPIDPGMSAFDHPSAGTMARDRVFFLLFLSTAANVRKVLVVLNDLETGRVIIAGIQTQVLRRGGDWLWPCNHQAFQRGAQQLHI